VYLQAFSRMRHQRELATRACERAQCDPTLCQRARRVTRPCARSQGHAVGGGGAQGAALRRGAHARRRAAHHRQRGRVRQRSAAGAPSPPPASAPALGTQHPPPPDPRALLAVPALPVCFKRTTAQLRHIRATGGISTLLGTPLLCWHPSALLPSAWHDFPLRACSSGGVSEVLTG